MHLASPTSPIPHSLTPIPSPFLVQCSTIKQSHQPLFNSWNDMNELLNFAFRNYYRHKMLVDYEKVTSSRGKKIDKNWTCIKNFISRRLLREEVFPNKLPFDRLATWNIQGYFKLCLFSRSSSIFGRYVAYIYSIFSCLRAYVFVCLRDHLHAALSTAAFINVVRHNPRQL